MSADGNWIDSVQAILDDKGVPAALAWYDEHEVNMDLIDRVQCKHAIFAYCHKNNIMPTYQPYGPKE